MEIDTGDTGAPGEAINGVSRTSSGNGKKRSKKSRRNNDDFEARSQFNAFYPTPHYPTSSFEQIASPMAYFGSYPQQGSVVNQSGSLGAAIFQQGYSQGFHSMSTVPAYPIGLQNPSMPVSDMNGQFPGVPMYPEYNQQYQPQYYQHMMQHPPMMGQQSPIMSSPALSAHAQLSRPSSQMSDQNWSQNSFSYPYHQPRQPQQGYMPQMQERSMSTGNSTVSYPYGQLPYQPNVQQGKPQHPLPGSYSRPAFNPQTRAFVPSSGYQAQNNAQYSGTPGDAKIHNPLVAPPNGNSNLSQRPQANALHMPFGANQSRKTSSQSASSQPNASQPSSLAKWGTPATLPPKPPPPETSSILEGQHSLPPNIHAPVNIQPLMNGQPMPSFHNGVYSTPSSGSH